MAEHAHGKMDIKVQEDTFEGFMNWVTKSVIVIMVALILMAIFWI